MDQSTLRFLSSVFRFVTASTLTCPNGSQREKEDIHIVFSIVTNEELIHSRSMTLSVVVNRSLPRNFQELEYVIQKTEKSPQVIIKYSEQNIDDVFELRMTFSDQGEGEIEAINHSTPFNFNSESQTVILFEFIGNSEGICLFDQYVRNWILLCPKESFQLIIDLKETISYKGDGQISGHDFFDELETKHSSVSFYITRRDERDVVPVDSFAKVTVKAYTNGYPWRIGNRAPFGHIRLSSSKALDLWTSEGRTPSQILKDVLILIDWSAELNRTEKLKELRQILGKLKNLCIPFRNEDQETICSGIEAVAVMSRLRLGLDSLLANYYENVGADTIMQCLKDNFEIK